MPLVTDPTRYTRTDYTDTGLTNNSNAYEYVVRAVNSNGTEGDPSESAEAIPLSQDFESLNNAGIFTPISIASNGTTMWVLDSHVDSRMIFAYTIDGETRDPAKDIPLADATGSPAGIWVDGEFNTVFVLNRPAGATAEIHAYDVRNRNRVRGDEFASIIGGSESSTNRGIWSDGTDTMWVSNDEDGMIYAYVFNNKMRNMSADITLVAENTDPRSIWSNLSHTISTADATMWVLDATGNRIYAYDLEGTREMGNEFPTLATGNDDPWSIWSNGTTMFVLDRFDLRIYKYSMDSKALITE